MMNKYYIGIDPGITGAIAVVDIRGKFVDIYDLPTRYKYDNGKPNKILDFLKLENIISSVIAEYGDDCEVVLEDIHARGGWQASTGFSMGESCGTIRSAIDSMKLMINYVSSPVWKKHFKLGSDKALVLEYARRTMPEAREYIDRQKDHNRAEALLIARYMAETNNEK